MRQGYLQESCPSVLNSSFKHSSFLRMTMRLMLCFSLSRPASNTVREIVSIRNAWTICSSHINDRQVRNNFGVDRRTVGADSAVGPLRRLPRYSSVSETEQSASCCFFVNANTGLPSTATKERLGVSERFHFHFETAFGLLGNGTGCVKEN